MTPISILGATGSIGRQALEVCEEQGIPVAALAAGRNVARMEEQVRRFRPRLAVMSDEAAGRDLAVRLRDMDVAVRSGAEGLAEAAALPECGTVVGAIVGLAALEPVLAAARAGKRVALANKEALVCAGELVLAEADRCGGEIIPVDSEHSAIFQCLQGCRAPARELKRVILTCSGGPFFGLRREEVYGKTRAEALRHPTWSMGEKITVDSATLMNKGLECIEAMRLFHLRPEQVSVVIHRQSVIHSMVEFRDGAVLAQMGTPDMRLPIRYALTCPDRAASAAPPLDLLACPPLTFQAPDGDAFPCLPLALDCARRGGTACAILNGANEAAVARFLREEIPFGEIPALVEKALAVVPVRLNPSLADILEADKAARRVAG